MSQFRTSHIRSEEEAFIPLPQEIGASPRHWQAKTLCVHLKILYILLGNVALSPLLPSRSKSTVRPPWATRYVCVCPPLWPDLYGQQGVIFRCISRLSILNVFQNCIACFVIKAYRPDSAYCVLALLESLFCGWQQNQVVSIEQKCGLWVGQDETRWCGVF